MKTQSAKAKGRKLQQYVRDKLLTIFPTLEKDDIKSTSMGASGEDILLSPAARRKFPYSVECKSHASFAVYKHFEQAEENSDRYEPLLIIKANRKKPLVVLDLDHFLNKVK